MTAIYRTKRGDTLTLTVICRDADGPVDLTGATVTFHLRRLDGTLVVNAAATPHPNQGTHRGQVTYAGTTSDTAVAGRHLAEFQAAWGTTVVTFPRPAHLIVDVGEDLA